MGFSVPIDKEKTFKRFLRVMKEMELRIMREDVIEIVLKDGSIKRYFPGETVKERELKLVAISDDEEDSTGSD